MLRRLGRAAGDEAEIVRLVEKGERCLSDAHDLSALYGAAVNVHKCPGASRECSLCLKYLRALCHVSPSQARDFHNQQRAFGLGRLDARMYEARADMEARLGDAGKAAKMLREGLKVGAQPEELLRRRLHCLALASTTASSTTSAALVTPAAPAAGAHAAALPTAPAALAAPQSATAVAAAAALAAAAEYAAASLPAAAPSPAHVGPSALAAAAAPTAAPTAAPAPAATLPSAPPPAPAPTAWTSGALAAAATKAPVAAVELVAAAPWVADGFGAAVGSRASAACDSRGGAAPLASTAALLEHSELLPLSLEARMLDASTACPSAPQALNLSLGAAATAIAPAPSAPWRGRQTARAWSALHGLLGSDGGSGDGRPQRPLLAAVAVGALALSATLAAWRSVAESARRVRSEAFFDAMASQMQATKRRLQALERQHDWVFLVASSRQNAALLVVAVAAWRLAADALRRRLCFAAAALRSHCRGHSRWQAAAVWQAWRRQAVVAAAAMCAPATAAACDEGAGLLDCLLEDLQAAEECADVPDAHLHRQTGQWMAVCRAQRRQHQEQQRVPLAELNVAVLHAAANASPIDVARGDAKACQHSTKLFRRPAAGQRPRRGTAPALAPAVTAAAAAAAAAPTVAALPR